MRQSTSQHHVDTPGRGPVDLTDCIRVRVGSRNLQTGLLTVFACRTSASLLIQENADPGVQSDLGRFLALGTRQGVYRYEHRAQPQRREVVLRRIGT